MVFAILFAFLIVQQGLVAASTKSSRALPLAASLAPTDAHVLSGLADLRFQEAFAQSRSLGQNALVSQMQPSALLYESRELAEGALRQDITSVDALAIMGFAAQFEGDRALGRRIMEKSNSLSRRDNLTRLWFIEDAALRDDAAEMFSQFDIALRTSGSIQAQLFPLLSGLLKDPDLSPNFEALLTPDPDWAPAFLYSAATGGQSLIGLARLYPRLGKDFTYGGQTISRLIGVALVANGAYSEAFSFAEAMSTTPARDILLHDASFTTGDGLPPHSWELANTADFDLVRASPGSQDPGLSVLASGTGAGVVARQLLELDQGTYRFSSTVELSGSRSLGLTWRLRCAEGGEELGAFDPLARRSDTWSVPTRCPYQWLELYADSGEMAGDETAFIHPVSLKRVE